MPSWTPARATCVPDLTGAAIEPRSPRPPSRGGAIQASGCLSVNDSSTRESAIPSPMQ
jgi:hypothetical protein